MADLKGLRNIAGLTQAELAEKVGVSENTIQNWENGKTIPKGDNLNQYLSALGIKSQAEMKRIAGEISVVSSMDEHEVIDNTPYFLFPEGSEQVERIRNCYASAEELDMLAYVDYVSWNGKYSKLERRGDTRYPLEFAFFERYGGYNATRKKISDARKRLGGLYSEALAFAEENPGCDFRLVSFERALIINKIALFLGNTNCLKEWKDLYDSLKTIEAVGTEILSPANLRIRMEKGQEIERLLSNCVDRMTGEVNLGKLEGYVELEVNNVLQPLNISMLRLTERGEQLIQWFDEINNV